MKDLSKHGSDDQLIRRIYGEYLEMPGLQLTSRQAQRLFGLREQACARLLDVLVARGFLARRPDGRYKRASDGRPGIDPQPRESFALTRTA